MSRRGSFLPVFSSFPARSRTVGARGGVMSVPPTLMFFPPFACAFSPMPLRKVLGF